MFNIIDLLDEAKAASDIASDRKLAQEIDVNPTMILHWRRKQGLPRPYLLEKLALLAGRDPDKTILEAQAMRCQDDEQYVWQRILSKLNEHQPDTANAA